MSVYPRTLTLSSPFQRGEGTEFSDRLLVKAGRHGRQVARQRRRRPASCLSIVNGWKPAWYSRRIGFSRKSSCLGFSNSGSAIAECWSCPRFLLPLLEREVPGERDGLTAGMEIHVVIHAEVVVAPVAAQRGCVVQYTMFRSKKNEMCSSVRVRCNCCSPAKARMLFSSDSLAVV